MNLYLAVPVTLLVFLERASLSTASVPAFKPFSATSKEQIVADATSSPLASVFSIRKKQITQVCAQSIYLCLQQHQPISYVHDVTFHADGCIDN